MKPEVTARCNNGTRFKITYDKRKDAQYYVLYYRNDTIPLASVTGGKIKGKWLYLDSQPNYSDALAFMFEEIASIDAKEGT